MSKTAALPAALSDPKGPESLLKRSNQEKWPEELLGYAGYKPERLRLALIDGDPGSDGAAIPRAAEALRA
jgi:predicted methyltransferase